MTSTSVKPVFIIGPGQCGFKAIGDLLNLQRDCRIFCHAPPLLPWDGCSEVDLRSRMALLAKQSQRTYYGDTGSYYLPYLRDIFAIAPHAKVVCLLRPVEELQHKFIQHLQQAYPCSINLWGHARHSSDTWDPYWNRCYPQYDHLSREASVAKYCEQYYQLAATIQQQYPTNLTIIDPATVLESRVQLSSLFDFLQIPEVNRQYATGRWAAGHVDPLIRPENSTVPRPSEDPMDPRRCVILTPYHQTIHPQCNRGLDELSYRGYPVRRVKGFTSIDQARNQMATDAILDGFQETMWIDSDIGFEADDVERLRSRQLPLSSGIYAQKGKKSVASHLMPETESITFGKEGGPLEILFTATGFLHVRREVYLEVFRQNQLPICNEASGSPMIPFFEPMLHRIEDGFWYLVEDYAFSQRVRQAGYPIWADTSIRLWHFGSYGYGWEDTARQTERFNSFTINFTQQNDAQDR